MPHKTVIVVRPAKCADSRAHSPGSVKIVCAEGAPASASATALTATSNNKKRDSDERSKKRTTTTTSDGRARSSKSRSSNLTPPCAELNAIMRGLTDTNGSLRVPNTIILLPAIGRRFSIEYIAHQQSTRPIHPSTPHTQQYATFFQLTTDHARRVPSRSHPTRFTGVK